MISKYSNPSSLSKSSAARHHLKLRQDFKDFSGAHPMASKSPCGETEVPSVTDQGPVMVLLLAALKSTQP